MYKEDHNYTWDEMIAMGQAFMEEDPGNNGEGKTIGLAGEAWAWPWFAGLCSTHQMNDYEIVDDQYIWVPAQAKFLEGLKESKVLYDRGVLWKEQPAADQDVVRNKFITGELGMYFSDVKVYEYYKDILIPMAQINENMNIYEDVKPMFVTSPIGNYFTEEIADYWGAVIFNPEMSENKFARWLELSDYMAGEEGQRLSTVGIEGKDYVIDEEGEINLLWDRNEEGDYINPYKPEAKTFFELTVTHDKFAINDPNIPDEFRDDVKSILHRHLEDDVYVRPYSYDTLWFNGEGYTKYAGRLDDIRDKASEIIVSSESMEELEEEWQGYIESKREIVDIILEEMNEQLLKK